MSDGYEINPRNKLISIISMLSNIAGFLVVKNHNKRDAKHERYSIVTKIILPLIKEDVFAPPNYFAPLSLVYLWR